MSLGGSSIAPVAKDGLDALGAELTFALTQLPPSRFYQRRNPAALLYYVEEFSSKLKLRLRLHETPQIDQRIDAF